MAPGEPAWVAYVGTEAGTCAFVREVRLVERLPASWAVVYKDNPYQHVRKHFDKAKDSRIFATEVEARHWLVQVLEGRVEAARLVLRHREDVLNQWRNK